MPLGERGSAHLRSIRDYGCLAYQKQRVFSQMSAETSSFTGEKQLISFVLKLLNRDFSTGVGLQMRVELIVLLHAGFRGPGLSGYRNRISESAHLSARGRGGFGSKDT